MKGEYYKMEFDSWDSGTHDLSLRDEAAYLRFCHQQYRLHEPIPYSIKLMCSLWRVGHNEAMAILQRLIAAGKITVLDDGKLANERVMRELDKREILSEVRRAAVGSRWGRRGVPPGSHQGPTGVPTGSLPGLSLVPPCNPLIPLESVDTNETPCTYIREDKSREDKKPPIVPQEGTASEAPPKKQKRRGSDPSASPVYSAAFQVFWDAYPSRLDGSRAGSKPKAAEIYERLSALDREAIAAALPVYGRSDAVKRGIVQHATTWLNGRVWESFAPNPRRSVRQDRKNWLNDEAGRPLPQSDDEWRPLLAGWLKDQRGWPYWWAGPSPMFPTCKAPAHLLAEYYLAPTPASPQPCRTTQPKPNGQAQAFAPPIQFPHLIPEEMT